MSRPFTDYFRIPKEVFETGIADAKTFNEAMDWLDALFHEGGIFGDLHWKGPVTNFVALPAVGNDVGDTRITLDTLRLWIWNGSSWQPPVVSDKFETYAFSRSAPISNAYLRLVDGTPSNLTGYPIFKNSTVRFISVAVNAASVCTIEIYRSGAIAPIDTLALNGTFATKVSAATIPAGDQLQARVLGGPAFRPVVTVIVE